MIQPHWQRIAGLRFQANGDAAAVWMARDPDNDVVHVYDACRFTREVLPVIADALNARGRWVPVAWENKEIADKLLDRGCNMLPDRTVETDALAETMAREVWARSRSGRFKVDSRLKEWQDEFKTYNRVDEQVPRDTHPLMAATRYAVGSLEYARAERSWKQSTKTYPKVAMI